MKTHVLLCCANAVVGLSLLMAGPIRGATDPFYSSLYEEGRLALERRDFAAAERTLRVAAFGLLEEPQSLASCLTLLALAQDGGKKPEPFRASVRRIAELEQRFGAYRAGRLDPEARKSFEEAVRRNLTPSAVAALPWIERAVPPAPTTSKKSRRSPPAEPGPVKVAAADPRKPPPAGGAATKEAGGPASPVTASKAPTQAPVPKPPAAAPEKPQPVTAANASKAPAQTPPAERQPAAPEKQATAQKQEPAPVPATAAKPITPPAPPQAPPAPPALTPTQSKPAAAAADTGTPKVAAPAPQPAEPTSPAVELAKLRQTMQAATTLAAMKDVLRQAQGLAAAHPANQSVRRLVAEAAYRSSQWATAAAQYAQIEFDPEAEPLVCYYAAVSFFEAGKTSEAAKLLRSCRDLIMPTPAVQRYVERILGAGDAARPRP